MTHVILEPRTEAGKRLLLNLSQGLPRRERDAADMIAAIEAEATAAAEQRLRAELLRLHHRHTGKGGTGICDECLHTWPCATSRLLDSDTPAPREPEYPQPGCSCEPCQRAASPRQGEPVAGLDTWRHASRCETERGGAEVDCTCGLTAFRSLLPAQASDSPEKP